ncbi:MAG: hypothetical protein M1825_006223 [Sarcosagium campestre]|nr:MAG: hypothetical protein M1825_006223 [Sarcosagium campestre]
MQPFLQQSGKQAATSKLNTLLFRCISTNSAIHQGLRRSKRDLDGPSVYPRSGGRDRPTRGRQNARFERSSGAPFRAQRPNYDDHYRPPRRANFPSEGAGVNRFDKPSFGRNQTLSVANYGGRKDLRSQKPSRDFEFDDSRGAQSARASNGENFGYDRRSDRSSRSRPSPSRFGGSEGQSDLRRLDRRLGHEDSGRRRFPRSRFDEEGESDGDKADLASFTQRRTVNPPQSVPYTTPASQFLYGTSVVQAALQSSKRKLYKLYIYEGENRKTVGRDATMRKLALSRGIEVVGVSGDWIRLMDKMSEGRPHNGYILESSPVSKLPITSLEPIESPQDTFSVIVGHQSKEEEAINGTNPQIEYGQDGRRFPLILMLDGIVDPGNVGAILRSAYFLGVDAVAISDRQSAPLSAVAIKASAGAIEHLPILSLEHPGTFVDESRANGWAFYAAVAPPDHETPSASRLATSPTSRKKYISATSITGALKYQPCVLMLGSEGDGLRWDLRKKADHEIGIEGLRAGQGGVDSLNVSVAAALLCQAFLEAGAGGPSDSRGVTEDDAADPDRLF